MFNLLLVDDETPILEGLYNNIPWEECGFANVYKADEAKMALALMAQYRIDVVVTDISMPGMDGLELCDRIRKSWPLCRIILLTGYRDFDFARRAVDLGVYQYLVKPVRYEDLQSVVAGALAELQENLKQRRLLERARDRLHEMGDLLRERFLNSWLLQGSISPETDGAEMREAGVDVSPEMSGFAILLRWSCEEPTTPVVQLGVQELVEQMMTGSERLYFLQMQKNELLAVFLCGDRDSAERFFVQCCNRLDVLQVSVQKSMNRQLSAFVSRIGGAGEMRDVCAMLLRAIRRRSVEPGSILMLGDEDSELDLLSDARLWEAVEALDMKRLKDWLDDCMARAGQSRNDGKWRQLTVTAMLAAVSSDAIQRGVVYREMQSVCMSLMSLSLMTMDADAAEKVCLRAAEQYIACVRERQNRQRTQLAESVRQLILDQMESGVTVNAIAEQMHYSSSYLSHLVKEETGMTLEELLISLRMERACRLLSGGMRVQEVAMRVGYDNLAYFSRLFKQKIGMSPRQYANQM